MGQIKCKMIILENEKKKSKNKKIQALLKSMEKTPTDLGKGRISTHMPILNCCRIID